MSESGSCCKGGSCPAASGSKATIQNGKGDAPRNISEKFRSNYDTINWGNSKSKKRK